jgi:regulator of cell morphogenesis and NO signaling
MKVTAESRVGELVDQLPRAARVFETLGVDYCCNDQRTLGAATNAAGYDLTEVQELLNRSKPTARPSSRSDWSQAPFEELTSYIVQVHHRSARRMMVDLLELTARLASAHAAKHPEVWALQNALHDIARHLMPHMLTEERYLFPYIQSMDQKVPDASMVVPLFGTVEYPLQSVRHDHGQDLTFLDRIRDTTHNFSPPQDACARFRILYTMLAEFEGDLRQHIRLENDVLFPRAIEVEKKAARPC